MEGRGNMRSKPSPASDPTPPRLSPSLPGTLSHPFSVSSEASWFFGNPPVPAEPDPHAVINSPPPPPHSSSSFSLGPSLIRTSCAEPSRTVPLPAPPAAHHCPIPPRLQADRLVLAAGSAAGSGPTRVCTKHGAVWLAAAVISLMLCSLSACAVSAPGQHSWLASRRAGPSVSRSACKKRFDPTRVVRERGQERGGRRETEEQSRARARKGPD
ncbi:hypothetical protein CH63R_00342 [Colletotrichum higginsianum IMI 349063]|uniref:Uncharacterized protein n=1 Tax=Colletotrichum higginsianum (strain IMI 349063) TaxID=759273 RepID=A0A1B7YT84_COLHI|nr:hypothetical protein CH63R_00342 [Colletotrichum higginsianum IMI 349063]OBR15162.1 hypothetical protein CH63R_00342 [Colletotrichum higginsianum IMI 349063]